MPDRTTSAGFGPAGAIAPPTQPATSRQTLPDTSAHITTVGVKRKAFGTSGREVYVYTNHFVTTIPEGDIYHDDGSSFTTLHAHQ